MHKTVAKLVSIIPQKRNIRVKTAIFKKNCYICNKKFGLMEFYHLYPSEFQDLLQHDYGKESYIGQGNPASKILIIGKECTDADYAFINNAEIWKKKTPENIVNWFTGQSWNYYHPRHPFYGQLFLKDNNSKKNPKPWEKLNRGTCVTWKAYQKFINLLLPQEFQVKPRQLLNFYEHCFLTELSSNCMPKSVKNEITKESIKQRLSTDGILSHPFFKKFSVVILNVYHYIDWYEEIPIILGFDGGVMNYVYKGIIVSETEYDEKIKDRLKLYRTNNRFKKGEFINVHESADGSHILLHTNHFVDKFQPRSDDYMKQLACLVRPYLNR